jgi:excisionase family DNA binding protein
MERPENTKESFVNMNEACAYLGVKKQTLYSWKSRGLIPCYKPSGEKGVLLFKLSEIKEFVEKGKVERYEQAI